jgi:hypothetical protein
VPPTPADRVGARVDCFPTRAAFPKWPEGRHPHCHFRGLHRLHSVTAHRIAQPPKAAFVTRLQPFRLPGRTARQLPDQSTTLWVESSSTGVSRLRGARPTTDITQRSKDGVYPITSAPQTALTEKVQFVLPSFTRHPAAAELTSNRSYGRRRLRSAKRTTRCRPWRRGVGAPHTSGRGSCARARRMSGERGTR